MADTSSAAGKGGPASAKPVPWYLRESFFLVDDGVAVLRTSYGSKRLVWEILLYTCFVVLFLAFLWNNVLIVGANGVRSKFVTDVVEYEWAEGSNGVPASFDGLSDLDNVWHWLERGLLGNPVGLLALDDNVLDGSAVRFGAVRLRQVRTQALECATPEVMAARNFTCQQSYSLTRADTEPLTTGKELLEGTPAMPERGAGGVYTYRGFADLFLTGSFASVAPYDFLSSPVTGRRYPLGGYVVDLPAPVNSSELVQLPGSPQLPRPTLRRNDSAALIVKQLRADDWLDSQTAALAVTANLYSPGVNAFALVRFLVEFQVSGNVFTSFSMEFFRLPGASFKRTDAFNDGNLRLLFALLLAVYLGRLFWSVYRTRRRDLWDVFDLINLSLIAGQLAIRAYRQEVDSSVANFDQWIDGPAYHNLEGVAWWSSLELHLSGANIVMSMIKYFKFLRLQLRLSIPLVVISQAAAQLFWFGVISVVFFIGFTTMAFLMFGPQLAGFSQLAATIGELSLYVGRETDFVGLQPGGKDAQSAIGDPMTFFFLFVLLFLIALYQMLVAIIVNSYNAVSRQVELEAQVLADRRQLTQLSNQLAGRTWYEVYWRRLLSWLCMKRQEHVLNRMSADQALRLRGYLSFDELLDALAGVVPEGTERDHAKRLMSMQRIDLSSRFKLKQYLQLPPPADEEMEKQFPTMVAHKRTLDVADAAVEGVEESKAAPLTAEEEKDAELLREAMRAIIGSDGDDDATSSDASSSKGDDDDDDDNDGDEDSDSKHDGDDAMLETLIESDISHTMFNRKDWEVAVRSGRALHSLVYLVRNELDELAESFKRSADESVTAAQDMSQEMQGLLKQMRVLQESYAPETLGEYEVVDVEAVYAELEARAGGGDLDEDEGSDGDGEGDGDAADAADGGDAGDTTAAGDVEMKKM